MCLRTFASVRHVVTSLILRIHGFYLSKVLIEVRLCARIYRYEYAYMFVSVYVFTMY